MIVTVTWSHYMSLVTQVRMVSFTGSTLIGQRIAQLTATSMKKVSLELGGKNAAVIFSDADLPSAVAGVTRWRTKIFHYQLNILFHDRSAFLNQGEICLCTSRIFVQRPVYQEFITKFIASVKTLKVGDPMEEDTFCGAVNSKIHYDKVMSYIRLAQEDPEATIHTGEGVTPLSLAPHNRDGFFIQPTIISGVGDDHRCAVSKGRLMKF